MVYTVLLAPKYLMGVVTSSMGSYARDVMITATLISIDPILEGFLVFIFI